MKNSLFFAALVIPLFASAQLPEQLKHLEVLADDETALVDAMREFHTEQEALARWDGELAQQYSDSGEDGLAEAKAEDLRKRLEAIDAGWQFVLAKYPNNPRANNYYGEYLYDYTQEGVKAIQHWLQAIALDPDFGPAHNNLGVHYLHTGSARQGLQHLHTAIEIDPDHPDYLFNITQAYLNQRRDVQRFYAKDMKQVYSDAMKFSRHAAEMAPDDLEIVQDYAVNFYAAEQFDLPPDWPAAAAAWDRVIALAKEPVDEYFATLNKARVMIRMKKWAEAVTLLERSLELMPDSDVAASLLEEARYHLEGGGRKEKKRRSDVL